MKFLAFILLGILSSQVSFASTSIEADLAAEEQALLQSKVTSKEEHTHKLSFLASYKKARAGFKQWKKENPKHKEIIAEFKQVLAKINTPGSSEQLALKSVQQKCAEKDARCDSMMSSTLENIYNQSEIPLMAQKKSFSIFPAAYAAAVGTTTCTAENYGVTFYFAGLFGASTLCNISFFGPGLGIGGTSYYAKVCVGSGQGTNAGPFVSVNAIGGLGIGLTVGEGGLCQVFSAQGPSIGAFAGAIVTVDHDHKYFK